MLMPKVTELAADLEPVTPDPFIQSPDRDVPLRKARPTVVDERADDATPASGGQLQTRRRR
jgi:hypothetical protein